MLINLYSGFVPTFKTSGLVMRHVGTVLMVLFFASSLTLQAQTTTGEAEASPSPSEDAIIDRLADKLTAKQMEIAKQQIEQAAIAEKVGEISNLIRSEKFDEARKEIRGLEQQYPGNAGIKQVKSYLDIEVEAANKKIPLQAAKDEINDLLLSGNTSAAKSKVVEAKKSFPQDKELSELSTIVTYVALLKKFVILVALLAGLSVITVGVIYTRSKFIAACVYVFTVYLTSLPIAILLFLIVGPILAITNTQEVAEQTTVGAPELQNMMTLFKQAGLATLSCCAGALGGAMSASFGLVTASSKARANLRFSTYFFKPVNGFFIAFIMYVGVMSGQLAFSSGNGELGDQARWSICLLAILSGFFSDAAIEKLREIKQALFGKELVVVTDIDEAVDNTNSTNRQPVNEPSPH